MDNYEIVHRLGLGGCGSVYLVRHNDNKRLLAMKKIELDERKKTRTKEAVQKEARILSVLKHPHIVAYLESFYDDNSEFLYIIQDFCDGGSLDDKIKEAANKKKHFDEAVIMCWFVQMTMAVQYIHSNKILHRDLKAENVFLTKKNVIKIGDFGISKVLDSTIDVAKTVVGTPSYLSPELCQDIPYSSKSDIWALGCLLYEMCALTPPFDAQSLISLFFKIIKGEYERIPSQYSNPLFDVIKSILVKTPDDRPSASALLNQQFVKQHLEEFIKEKETLLQLKGNRESSSRSSPYLQVPETCKSSLLSESPATTRRKKEKAAGKLDSRSPKQQDSGVAVNNSSSNESANSLSAGNKENLSDYSDDFDESSDEEIPEDIKKPVESEENLSEGDYDDDFEEYDSGEDLDLIVNQAKEAQIVKAKDEFFADDRMLDHHKTHTVNFRRHCMDALGHKANDIGQLIRDGAITEADLKKELRHTVGDSTEICHLDIGELPMG